MSVAAALDLDNDETLLPDSPLQYRATLARPPDHAVIWRAAQIRNVIGYRIVAEGPDLRTLQRL